MTDKPLDVKILVKDDLGTHTFEDWQAKKAVLLPVSLRDYFAANTLQGLMPSEAASKIKNQVDYENRLNAIAGVAYDVADAMLKARRQ